MNLLAAISAHWKKLDRFDRLLVALPVLAVSLGLLVLGWESWPACPVDSSGNALVLECSQINRNYGLMVGGVVAAIVAGFALLLNWRRTENDSKRLDGDAARLENDRRRIANDTYVKAIEQLGSPAMEVRLGAIYALERIAATDRDYHWPIMETLCAYIRERPAAKWGEDAEAGRERTTAEPLTDLEQQDTQAVVAGEDEDREEVEPERKRPPTDIQAILAVFERRSDERKAWEKAEGLRLNLRHVKLRRAFLQHIRLPRADLTGADLVETNMVGAFFSDAYFADADATNSNWRLVNLKGAYLGGVSLRNTDLLGADCREISLSDADLSGANLVGAKFSEQPSKLDAVWSEDDPPRNLNKIIVADD